MGKPSLNRKRFERLGVKVSKASKVKHPQVFPVKILLESRLAFIEKIEKEKGLPEALSACKGLLESISFRRIKPGEDFSSRKKKLPRLPFSREELLFMRFKLKQKLTQLERASGLKARKS